MVQPEFTILSFLAPSQLVQSTFTKLSNAAQIDDVIAKATSLDDVLDAGANPNLAQNQAVRLMAILSEMEKTEKVKFSDFERDGRFKALCQVLHQNSTNSKSTSKRGGGRTDTRVFHPTDDLSLVMNVAGEHEAAKLVGTISLSQMVQVLKTLEQKRKRSTPLLRSLAHNMSSCPQTLNLKECADVLYSMATLNFSDTVLVTRISVDIQRELPLNINRPAAVGSIVTSLGLLKYRDTGNFTIQYTFQFTNC